MKDKYNDFKIDINDLDKRLDVVIRKFLPELPLKRIFKSIRAGDIRINGKKVKQNYRLKLEDTLSIYKPLLSNKRKETTANCNLDKNRIVFENDDILIYNKNRGELVHGSKDSLDIKAKNYLKNKIKTSLSFSPGPLHRLDRNTQGLIVFSVSLKGAREFSNQLQAGNIRKVYLTVVQGEYKNKEEWRDNLERDKNNNKSFESDKGDLAITSFIPLISKAGKTLALMDIKSGRTHQIRVQSSIHNRPLIGDNKYNSVKTRDSYFLSAISLTFTKKSDILEVSNFYLGLDKQNITTLQSMFSNDDLIKSEVLIKRELNI